ncbi:MAG: protein-L-isoaspartate(D-aspartate) O-methyltransferase [Armatimonadota bacterium]
MAGTDEHAAERRAMVEHQLRRRRIADERVLAAMEKVPRHRFLPSPSDPAAYGDHPLPIGDGQTISQPYMVALMTEALCLTGDETVLEIGTGSGYQAAILAELAREVYSVERFPALAERARAVLADLGYDNITVVVGDGSLGHPEAAPYDRIIVTAAAPEIAHPWVEQLAEEGILVVPLGDRWGQTLTRCVMHQGKLHQTTLGGCVFVPLVGEHGWND